MMNSSRSAILSCIQRFTDYHGYPPTVRDICEDTGLRSSSTVHAHLRQLQADRMIEVDPMVTRGIRITPEGMDWLGTPPAKCPHCGHALAQMEAA